MHEAQVTITGYVGTTVDFRSSSGNGNDRAVFRLGSTSRFKDREGQWRDRETVWMTVKAWRSLAQNVAASVRLGEPVIVVGRLRTERWKGDDGHDRYRDVLEATNVAHDLNRGTAAFRRNDRPTELPAEAGRPAPVRTGDDAAEVSDAPTGAHSPAPEPAPV
ncbi:single-stranded DNA-binding protein [Nocardioidaceae bacterium SCSIO 66511]|nr:single-stranded DNA-binding protein [Nocardioidaceae bacterium SCSIO 66511]